MVRVWAATNNCGNLWTINRQFSGYEQIVELYRQGSLLLASHGRLDDGAQIGFGTSTPEGMDVP